MSEELINFELPGNKSVKKFIAKLSKQADLQITAQHYAVKTFYDSFDWRLYTAGIICEFNHSRDCSRLKLIDNQSHRLITELDIDQAPSFSEQFPDSQAKALLGPILEMRALLPVCQLPYELFQANILNNDKKIVLRLQIEQYELLNNRIQLFPLKGYQKAHHKMVKLLQQDFQVKPASDSTILNEALKQQGRKPKDYRSKFKVKLNPDMSADEAGRLIFKKLLKTLRLNEAGAIADIDTEFLHDFRIAVRRTRTGLNQFKQVFPAEIVSHYASFFAWLGQITGPTRDLDVYLLSFPRYQAALPVSLREDIRPLYEFLKQKQRAAQNQMATHLKSPHYNETLVAWEEYLNSSAEKNTAPLAKENILQLANARIWKIYRRVLKEGTAIDNTSPAEALHDLRKTCKKLRYLMEFFSSLYPEKQILQAIKILKQLQTVLGDFQDYEIQESSIKHFSEELMEQRAPANTLLALGVLVQYLDQQKWSARNHFDEQFKTFTDNENQALFKQLFRQKP